jgi:hypothetical protein
MERAVIALFRIVVILALCFGVLCYVYRDRVGGVVLEQALRQRGGLECSRPDVRVGASLNYVRLSPLHCRMSDGPVRAFETGITHLRLLRMRVRSAELEYATVDYRARDVSYIRTSPAKAQGRADETSSVRQLLLRTMLDASEMYSADAPRIAVNTLTAKREGRVQLVMHGFRKSMDGDWDRSQADMVEWPDDAGLVMRALDMRVIPSWGNLSATLSLGPQRSADGFELRIEGRRLDGIKPRVVAEVTRVLRPRSMM